MSFNDQTLQDLIKFQAPSNTPSVVLVDDEPVVLELLTGILEGQGYDLESFDAAEPALEAIKSRPPVVVVTDKNLPTMNGIELIREGKLASPLTEFLMVTGYASLDSAIEAMEAGAFSYLTKPFRDVQHVRQRIREAVNKNEAVLQNRLLTDRLKNAFEDLFKAKVEIEMLNEIAQTKLGHREDEIRELLEKVLKPLAAALVDVRKIADHFQAEGSAEAEGLLRRARMVEKLLGTSRDRAEKLTESLRQ